MKEKTKIMDQSSNFNLSEYYKELESIPNKHRLPLFGRLMLHCLASLSKQNRTDMQRYHFYLVLTELFNPFNATIGKISEHRNIGGDWDKMIDVGEGFDEASIHITVAEVYDMLKSLPLNNVSYLFQKIEISQLDYEKLLDSLTTNNKNAFTEIICRNEGAINILKRFYYNYEPIYQHAKGRKHCANKSRKKVREAFDELHWDQGVSKEFKDFMEYGREISAAPTKASPPPLLAMLKMFEQQLLDYLYHKDEYNLTEQNIIEKIVKQPKYINRYNRIYSKYLKIKQTESILDNKKNALSNKKLALPNKEAVLTDEEFTLPNNYFELSFDGDACISLGDIGDHIKQRGVENFKNFIDYVASKGYIDNDTTTKENFAYRLTGRLKPTILQDKIQWKENNSCLYYIVKFCYKGNGRTGLRNNSDKKTITSKYQRIKFFFDNYEASINGSQQADYADEEFTNKVAFFFPKEKKASATILRK